MHNGSPSAAHDQLDQLATGALNWVCANAGYLVSPAAESDLAVTPRVKALLQLAMLRHHWEKAWPRDDRLAEVTAVLRRVWQDPEFPRLMAADPSFSWFCRLMYVALAPPGTSARLDSDVLAQVAGHLVVRGRTPLGRLETRYLADVAGMSHEMESYHDLYRASILSEETSATATAELDPCVVAHTIFYLTHFGFRDPGLAPGDQARSYRIACDLSEYSAQRDEWEDVGKLVLAQFCLGGDPISTSSGRSGIQQLAEIQMPDGAIPGPSRARRVPASSRPQEYFRKVYKVTAATALMSVIVSAGRQASRIKQPAS